MTRPRVLPLVDRASAEHYVRTYNERHPDHVLRYGFKSAKFRALAAVKYQTAAFHERNFDYERARDYLDAAEVLDRAADELAWDEHLARSADGDR